MFLEKAIYCPIIHIDFYKFVNELSKSYAITILEKTEGVFFKPNGITLYAKDPHYVMKVVFLLSSSAILTWWYPENPSVNEYASFPVTCSSTSFVKGVGKGSCT
jgi:hypothetical protein